MVPPNLGIVAVNRTCGPVSARWTLVAVAAVTLALAGCGRKGPLDLPPNAMNSSAVGQEPQDDRVAPPGTTNPGYNVEGGPVAPKGRKKPFILDPLLD